MEKFNQAPVPDKDETEFAKNSVKSIEVTQTPDKGEMSEEFEASRGAFINDVSSSPEYAPESPSEKMARMREQKTKATERLHSEFWSDELDDVSTYRIRNILAKAQGKEQAEDDFKPSPRGMQAVEVQKQIDSVDSQIDQTYDKNPDLVESRLKEIIDGSLDASRLSYFKSVIEESGSVGVGPGGISIDDREFLSLISKFEKHQGYDRSADKDTPETWSPKYDFLEEYVAQLIQEQADEVAAYEALSTEEKERYSDKQTVREKLSYQDADLPPEQLEVMLRDAEGRDTAEQYAHHLNHLPEREVERVLPQIKGQTKKVLDVLGVPVSPYGKSDSWAYWDLGKQQFYYEQNKDSETEEGNPYRYAPALEKLDEMSDRHIGWEFYHAPAEAREKAFKSIEDSYYLAQVFEVLQNNPKADGQLASHEYAELGKVLREYARSKESDDSVDDMLAVQREANYEGNDSELLFDRLDNSKILDQIVQMWMAGYKAKEGKIEQRPTQDEDGGIVFDVDGNYVLEDVLFVPPSEEETREKIAELIKEAKTSTPVFFDGRAPTSDGIGLDWKLPGDVFPSTKQKSIILAHEKGHLMRQFPGGVEGDAYFREMFGKAFDMNNINFTEQDFEDTVTHRKQEKQITGYGLENEDYTYDRMRESTIGYLSSPEEIVERMGQLKNYFGFKGDEEFTQEHLDYARGQYIKDTGLDNNMRHFFEGITDDQEFLPLINSVGV
jgi:hypothetical protein